MSPTLAILISGILAAACVFGGFIALRKKRIIDDLPTSKTQGVFIGLTELKGQAESENPFNAYLSGTRCVWYAWKIEEHWSKTVTETYTDNKGHLQTRTRTETGWKQIDSGGEHTPFYLKDDTGVIRIVPEGADIQAKSVFNETCGRDNPLYFNRTSASEIANSTHKRRFSETALPLHTVLYVLGQARERQDIVAAEIAKEKHASFVISTRSEKQISSGYGRWSWFFVVLGLICAIGGGIGWVALSVEENQQVWKYVSIMATSYFILILVVYVWTTYNNLINLHHRVEQGRSQIDVQLKRRHDLIPNLVSTVEGFRQHENITQNVLAGLRGQLETAETENRAISASLRVMVEKYPDLKANDGFLKLQNSLVDTEQRIALARDYYNDIATFFCNRLQMIPERYVGLLAGLHKPELVVAQDYQRAVVAVNLAD